MLSSSTSGLGLEISRDSRCPKRIAISSTATSPASAIATEVASDPRVAAASSAVSTGR